jgi:phosphoglycolate phosphatase
MEKKKYRAVLFDLDGTLMDTLAGLTQLVNLVREDFEKPPISEEEVSRYIGKGVKILIERSMTRSMDGKLDPATFRVAEISMDKHVRAGTYDRGRLFPGVKEAVLRLKEEGYTVGIVTNKAYGMTLEELRCNGVSDLFDVVVGGDTAAHPKPYPDPLLLAAERIGLEPKDCVFVGDSGNDSEAAYRAGMPCILVRTGWSEGISLEEIQKKDKVSAILGSVKEVPDFLA